LQLRSQVDALAGGNAEELRRLVSLWNLSIDSSDWETSRSEELMVFGALLAGSTGRHEKEVVIDFFLVGSSSSYLPFSFLSSFADLSFFTPL